MGALTDGLEAERQIIELRAALEREQKAHARLKTKRADFEGAILQGARDAALVVGIPGPVPRPARDRRRSPEVALLHLTDWQLGKRTESYDSDICRQRVEETVRRAIKLTEIQKADHPVRECHVMLGGDLVEGISIFPGQVYEVDATTFSQVFSAAGLVTSAILTLLESFEKVTVSEVAGNHGRMGRKGDAPREDNLDRIVGRVARDQLANQPRLHWQENKSWYSMVEIGNYRALLVHGDQVKSFGGNVPAYGLLRKGNSWAAGGIPETFKDIYVGHLHQPMTLQLASGGLIYMTPSTESGSAYAREFMAAHGRPGQRLHFIDPAKGRVTAQYLIDFE